MASRSPKPRQQKRKRKVDTKTNDESSGINDEDTSHDVVVAKRPCRRRRRENVANLDSNRQVSIGVANRQSGGNADMISRQVSKSIQASSSSCDSRKASSILQRLRRQTNDTAVQKESNNTVHSTKEEEEASSVDKLSDTTTNISDCNEINTSLNTNTKKDTTATAMIDDDKQTSNYIAYIRERRKLQYIILTVVIFGTLLLTILSATIYLQHSNHNLIILERDAITSQTTEEQLAQINKRHNLQMKALTDINNKLQQSYEQQHSIILDMTSMIQSMQSSLTSCKEDIETQRQESINAVEAVAHASNQFAIVKAQAHELERINYIEHMELAIDRIKDEAIGAVHAVATAAGKLEYERKLEEEERWRRYTKEAESILGSIRNNVQDDDEIRVVDTKEASVLRAAISRRIEEGLTSLRSYVYPYNYLKRREDRIITQT